MKIKEFKKELISLLNRYSKENDSDTPDFILAEYLINCLEVYGKTVKNRDKWFNVNMWADLNSTLVQYENKTMNKNTPKRDGSGQGTRTNKGRGGCAKPRVEGKTFKPRRKWFQRFRKED